MICPHCNQNILYKERGGQKCSKCNEEFAFEPKNHPLGLHDIRFRKAVARLSEGDKLYFTSGQLLHFLSRQKIKNSFRTIRGFLVFVSVFVVIAIVVGVFVTEALALFFLAILVAVVFIGLLSLIWKKEGRLSLTHNSTDFENDLTRWKWIYKQLPPRLIATHLPPPDSPGLANLRGVLVCSEPEILMCLAANATAENLGLLLLNPYLSADKLDFVRQRQDWPVFVLHDASPEGCLQTEEFVRTHLGNNRNRRIYDIGLRPQTAIKTSLMRLRTEIRKDLPPSLVTLTAEEIAWLQNGNYTPLLALRPAQLIKFVTVAVTKRLQSSAKNEQQTFGKNNQKEAQEVGFMTWVSK